MEMRTLTVPKSKFKPKAFAYIRMVEERRDEICITDHGRPVAKIVPYTESDDRELVSLRGLVRSYEDPLHGADGSR